MIKLFIGNQKGGKDGNHHNHQRNTKEFYRKLKKVTTSVGDDGNSCDDELAKQVVAASLQFTAHGLFSEARDLTKLCCQQILNEKLLKEAARVSSAM